MKLTTSVFILVPLVVGASQAAFGGIIHTVVNDTIDLSSGVLQTRAAFDLNQDGFNDFEIEFGMYPDPDGYEPTAWGISFHSQGTDIQNRSAMSSHSIRYSAGDTILPESSSFWTSISYGPGGLIAGNGSILDPMPSDVGGIYALRMMIDSQEHFGWVRIDYQGPWSQASVTVRDFAFGVVPNSALLAGEIPAPGPVALLLFAGLISTRRHRRPER